MINFIKKIKYIYELYKLLINIDNLQRTSLFRMLYWKTHYAAIPNSEFKILIGNGWLVETGNDSYTWSDEANRIVTIFDKINIQPKDNITFDNSSILLYEE